MPGRRRDNDDSTTLPEAVRLALDLGSAALDVASLVAECAEELPYADVVLKTLRAINDKAEQVRSNKEGILKLKERCAYVTACLFIKNKTTTTDVDLEPLKDLLRDAEKLVERCGSRGCVGRILKATRDKNGIEELHRRLDKQIQGVTLALQAATLEVVQKLKDHMVRFCNTYFHDRLPG